MELFLFSLFFTFFIISLLFWEFLEYDKLSLFFDPSGDTRSGPRREKGQSKVGKEGNLGRKGVARPEFIDNPPFFTFI